MRFLAVVSVPECQSKSANAMMVNNRIIQKNTDKKLLVVVPAFSMVR